MSSGISHEQMKISGQKTAIGKCLLLISVISPFRAEVKGINLKCCPSSGLWLWLSLMALLDLPFDLLSDVSQELRLWYSKQPFCCDHSRSSFSCNSGL